VAIALLPHFNSSPWIPEIEFSGTVAAIGDNSTTRFEIGDAIFGGQSLAGHWKYGGCLAEYVVTTSDLIVEKPKNVSMAGACGLAGVGCTAIQAGRVVGLKRGDKILVNGASGGLGTILVQYCRAVVGETGSIVATCSEANTELVKSLGADEVRRPVVTSDCHCTAGKDSVLIPET